MRYYEINLSLSTNTTAAAAAAAAYGTSGSHAGLPAVRFIDHIYNHHCVAQSADP